jgi:hypothetical protein
MDLREVDWEGVHWSHLAQDRDQCRPNECGNEPSGFIKGLACFSIRVTVIFLRSYYVMSVVPS